MSELPWIIFAVYWLIGALKTNPTRKSEPFASRYGILAILVAGFVFLFDDSAKIGPLKLRFVPHNLAIEVLGIVLTWLGIGLAVWARFHLAQYWSARITIKEGHELIRTGPYAHLRHPIYSGLLVAMAGSALLAGQWSGLLGLALVLLGFSEKALKEESMLKEQFGEKFQEHRRHTGFLLPRWR